MCSLRFVVNKCKHRVGLCPDIVVQFGFCPDQFFLCSHIVIEFGFCPVITLTTWLSSSSASFVAIDFKILVSLSYFVLTPFCCQQVQASNRILSRLGAWIRALQKWVGLSPDIVIEFGFSPGKTGCFATCKRHHHLWLDSGSAQVSDK